MPTTIIVAALFVSGYLLIATEQFVKINKAATAMLTGVACWTVLALGAPAGHEVMRSLFESTADIAGVLLFLMGAMSIVEILDSHDGFSPVTAFLAGTGKRRSLVLVGILSFLLSAVLDNLTTTIVMISLLTKMLPKRDDLLLFSGLVIIAVNAGGAWSPIGDVTTTMLWIGGQVTSLSIMKRLFLPSLASLAIPLAWLVLQTKSDTSGTGDLIAEPPRENGHPASRIIFFLGIGVLLMVPVFRAVTHLPPFIGMLGGLAVMWIGSEFLHRNEDPKRRHDHSMAAALSRIDMQTILFFLGILLGISALQTAGILAGVALWLDRAVGNTGIIAMAIGLLSSIVDNVPLVAAGIKMYPLSQFPANHQFWSLLSYCVGTGGSVLVIGSAAGVAAMGMAKIDFFWYLKRIAPLALAGYFAGVGVFLLQRVIGG